MAQYYNKVALPNCMYTACKGAYFARAATVSIVKRRICNLEDSLCFLRDDLRDNRLSSLFSISCTFLVSLLQALHMLLSVSVPAHTTVPRRREIRGFCVVLTICSMHF